MDFNVQQQMSPSLSDLSNLAPETSILFFPQVKINIYILEFTVLLFTIPNIGNRDQKEQDMEVYQVCFV